MINEHILQLTGKATLPIEMKMEEAYTVELTGEVVSETKVPNQDGTHNVLYKFKPIIALIKDTHGTVAKTKDLRNNSVKFRKSVWKVWADKNLQGDFETFYDYATTKSILLLDKIAEEYDNKTETTR